MKQKIIDVLYKLSYILEIYVSVIILIAIGLFSIALIKSLFAINILNSHGMEYFTTFLGHAFALVIGVEFIRMLLKHSLENVIEVLMFALARQMIVEHTTTLDNLYGIAGIAILFFIRRYLLKEKERKSLAKSEVKILSEERK